MPSVAPFTTHLERHAPCEVIANGFHFPTSLTFDPEGVAYVAESGLPLGGAPPGGRVWRVASDGVTDCLVSDLRCPVNGLTWHDGILFIAEGGTPGRISRLVPGRRRETLLDNLPGGGDYHTNEAIVGPDNLLYFGQGAASNSGIVGPDTSKLAWRRGLTPQRYHDLPGHDIVVNAVNAVSADPVSGENVRTGPFVPYGETVEHGRRIPAKLPCTSAIMRCQQDGSQLELVAWGLRNPFGLGFLNDGRLIATDLGLNDRGSRPIGAAESCLYHVEKGYWYGWPDFAAGRSVSDPRHHPERGRPATPLLAPESALPPLKAPLFRFPVHSAPTKFEIDSNHLYVALFGDKLPLTGPRGPRSGRAIVKLNIETGAVTTYALPGLQRPIDVKRNPVDGHLYIVDFGVYELRDDLRVRSEAASGTLLRLPHF